MNPNQAGDAREALAKELYSRLFAWLVQRINSSTASRNGGHDGSGPTKGDSNSLRTIGLLDIFGFESFTINRFEQLMINFCNEKIQQKFTVSKLVRGLCRWR